MANGLFDQVYNPDVLSCLANLSNDEVFTPPEIVNQMLDMLPQELFENPDTTFLDPACKTGVFLREIAKRLIIGLEPQIPDLQERIDHILPSEKAFAYKMKLEAIKHQGKASTQLAQKLSVELVGDAAGESKDQVRRYIRLTELIPDILQMVDDGKIALTPAVELSYLQDFEQEALFSIMDCDEVTPSLSQAQRLRRMSEDQTFTDRTAMHVLSEVKGNQKEYVKVPVDSLRSYFRPDTSIKQMTETLVKAMEFYNKHLERQRRDRDAR